MLKTVLLEEMTSPQIRAAIDAGYDTAIVCAGAIEQHGRHLPIGMDAMDGKLFAVRIAEELGNALAAPVIRPGCSDHHMAFAGTISISVSLLQDLCRAYCRCLSHHGFKEYGSPILPAIPEAFVLHYLDNLDAKMYMTFNAIETDPDTTSQFTSYMRQLETSIYKHSNKL